MFCGERHSEGGGGGGGGVLVFLFAFHAASRSANLSSRFGGEASAPKKLCGTRQCLTTTRRGRERPHDLHWPRELPDVVAGGSDLAAELLIDGVRYGVDLV